jgi:23S rRNA (cytidine2498-2'-O)-methyltransferase
LKLHGAPPARSTAGEADAQPVVALDTILAQCREGFEVEAAEDVAAIARAAQVAVRMSTQAPRSGFVIATAVGERTPDVSAWSAAQRRANPVFARSVCYGTRVALDPGNTPGRSDRVTPLARAAHAVGAAHAHALFLEFPDTNAGKALSTLARALQPRLVTRLAADGIATANATAAGVAGSKAAARTALRLHVFLLDGAHAIVGCSEADVGTPWPMGIPRLRVPAAAPSRSARKLVEAIVTFLGDRASEVLRPGMRAVDLGAAPGGWSWVLAHHGLRVTAIDNGPLKGAAVDDALITHLRSDGLSYRPRRPVDWVTCDIVESPSRIAVLMGQWIGEGRARHAIFNLKLPMKRRYAEVLRCRQIIGEALAAQGAHATLCVRQLYHDREEVTAYLACDYSPSQ